MTNPPTKLISIGDLSEQTGVHRETIRYYEREGVVPTPARSSSGRRLYTTSDANRLLFIRRCRDLGFSLADSQALAGLAAADTSTCAQVKLVVSKHRATLQGKLRDLRKLEKALAAMESTCPGSESTDCPILDKLKSDVLP